MQREEINIYIDGFLSLVPLSESLTDRELRTQLIEAAQGAENLETLIQDWLLLHDLGLEKTEEVFNFFRLNYRQLTHIFSRGEREVGQLLRSLRILRLPTYPPAQRALETSQHSGLSCFMVEQQLSGWLDGEIQDQRMVSQLQAHLLGCDPCRERRDAYRNLQAQQFLKKRIHPAISALEWQQTLQDLAKARRRFWRAVIFYGVSAVVVGALIITFFWVKPDALPNIYESP